MFAEYSFLSVTLGKGFAECIMVFAECLRHLTKKASPVVHFDADLCFETQGLSSYKIFFMVSSHMFVSSQIIYEL
jgi:hypothetical protein